MCRVLEVSRSGYYAWLVRPVSNRASSNNKLLKEIRRAHVESRKTYGSPRITRKLQKEGISCSKNRVARLMSSQSEAASSRTSLITARCLLTVTGLRLPPLSLPSSPSFISLYLETWKGDMVLRAMCPRHGIR